MALVRAAKNRREGLVRVLLRNGAEGYGKDRDGRTALWEGASNGHGNMIKLLLENRLKLSQRVMMAGHYYQWQN
jgi:ankyrin repeat protein